VSAAVPYKAATPATAITGPLPGRSSGGRGRGQLTEAGVPSAVVDLDWLRRSWPSPAGDRFNVAMALRNLCSVARNYRDARPARIVLAGVIETKVRSSATATRTRLVFHSRCAGFAWNCRWSGPDSPNGVGGRCSASVAPTPVRGTGCHLGGCRKLRTSRSAPPTLRISSTAKTVLSSVGWQGPSRVRSGIPCTVTANGATRVTTFAVGRSSPSVGDRGGRLWITFLRGPESR
jgi:hypothetical protein